MALTKKLPIFRKDLDIIPRNAEGGGFRYLVRDPRSGEIYEFGEEEYFLCNHFDGHSDLDSLQEAFKERFGVSVQLAQLEAFARHVETLGLGVSDSRKSGAGIQALPVRRIHRVFDPDGLFGFAARHFGWCFSRSFLVGGILVLALGIGIILKFWQDYMQDLTLITEGELLFVLPPLGAFFFNPAAEITKGIACKKFGGSVHAFNLRFVYRIIPVFFSDLSEFLWRTSMPVRARVLFPAIVSQALLWAVGIIGWKITVPGTAMHTFWTLFTFAAAFFTFLRMNPLLEQDGYALLSNWLDIPDLRNRAKRLAESWILFNPVPEPLFPREIVIFKRYGFPALLFEIVFWGFVLGVLGYHLVGSMKGVGACLFLAFLLFRFEDFLRRTFSRMHFTRWSFMNEAGRFDLRLLGRLALIGVFILLLFLPYPYESGGDFTFLPFNERGIRAQVPGEIEAVFVKEGDWVAQGQVLGKLTGREQRKKVEELEAGLDKSRANLALLKKGATPEEVAKARQEVKAAETAYIYSKSQADRAEKMFRDKALSEKDYENALRVRDLDKERLEVARKNLEVVESGFRPEQAQAIEAEIRALEVELKNAREDLEFIELKSPLGGWVITPNLAEKVGQYLATGELFAVVEDARTLKVEILLPEKELGEFGIGAAVRLRTWADPTTIIETRVTQIAPVAFEQSRKMIERAYSDREWLFEQKETIREKGRVIRVLCELDNSQGLLKTDMTGYAKIEGKERPVAVAFTRWLMRFLFVEVWSWIP
jgi:putative peptide zinc metalloprotease protein